MLWLQPLQMYNNLRTSHSINQHPNILPRLLMHLAPPPMCLPKHNNMPLGTCTSRSPRTMYKINHIERFVDDQDVANLGGEIQSAGKERCRDKHVRLCGCRGWFESLGFGFGFWGAGFKEAVEVAVGSHVTGFASTGKRDARNGSLL